MRVPRNVQESSPERSTPSAAAETLEAYGLTCGSLEPLIAQRLRALAPGDVLEVRSDMAEAADGIGAWVWLTGHTLVAIEKDEPAPRARYYVRKKTPCSPIGSPEAVQPPGTGMAGHP
jgi:TusA-related sulfurtransferase